MKNECTSVAGHFDCHAEAMKQNTCGIARCSMSRALLWKPPLLDAAIGQLLAPYHPGDRQGDNDNEQNNNGMVRCHPISTSTHHLPRLSQFDMVGGALMWKSTSTY